MLRMEPVWSSSIRSRPHDWKTPGSKPGSTIYQLCTWTRRMPNPKSRVKHPTVGVGRKPREEVSAQVSTSLSDQCPKLLGPTQDKPSIASKLGINIREPN
ncbi:hypothetical protein AVEN_33957-1 [Araneus ventricosus]|uniref:Uncharacterized protein n=1 Tax=Araneus ventricosus TaxID=182803 RepID=A0A4Y2MHN0_ARAVE|nr:hypothetical protein AVEN_33957-1 [Araneus ventricosus]